MREPGVSHGFDAEWPDGDGPLRRPPDEGGPESSAALSQTEALIIDVEGFEGPLDLLLTLARQQKVDLSRISILRLAEQYLDFIAQARHMRLEVAADYLVMAAWLAYLKSRLLLPEPEPEDEQPAEELAAQLAFRLRRLQALRDAAAALFARDKLGDEVFARGAPEPVPGERRVLQEDTLFDLLQAYAERRQKLVAHRSYSVRAPAVMPLKEARELLERLVGGLRDWSRLDGLLLRYLARPGQVRSVLASSFSATLEMARDGLIEMRQEGHFAPIYMRARQEGPEGAVRT
ncbi:segregation and condensation protein A [Rhodoligotrophos defluvii]|uniref:segregation and condensation protein A n=1 Tax=Rhodoligotrophos defluvii TaxID=2561934 RepID=UPI001EF0A77A|nr:ScpA family protein [Rhodoligotrophos defluvii]